MQQHQQINNNNECDIPFFKVFKNVYIRKLIFKFIKYPIYNSIQFNFNNYTYDQCKSTGWMIRNNHLQMLKEKVYNGENLIIECRYNFHIFSVFKDEQEFFIKLFENYSEYFQLSNSIQNLEIVERFIIENDNLSALKVIIEKYKFKPTIKSFILSFGLNSFEISEYLYIDHFSKKLTQKEKDNLWISVFRKVSHKTILNNIFGKSNHLFNQLGIQAPSPTSNKTLFELISDTNLFGDNFYYCKIEYLIDCCRLINQIKDHLNLDGSKKLTLDKFKRYTKLSDKSKSELLSFIQHEQLDLSIDQLSEIELKLSNLLSTNVKDIDKSNKQVESLVKMYLKYSDFESDRILEYWVLYKIIYQGDYQKGDQTIYEHYRFGEWFEDESRSILDHGLFQYLNVNDERIGKFIKSELNLQYKSGNINEQRLNCIVSYLLPKEDVYSIKLFEEFSKHPLIKKVSPNLFPSEFGDQDVNSTYVKAFKNVKTIEKFEIVYHLNDNTGKPLKPIIFSEILQNYKVSSHFKGKYTNEYYKSLDITTSLAFNVWIKYEYFKFIIDNWNDFSKFHSQIIEYVYKSFENNNYLSIKDFTQFIKKIPMPLKPFKIVSNFQFYLLNGSTDFTTPLPELEILQTSALYENDLIEKCDCINQPLLFLIQYYKFNHQEFAMNTFKLIIAKKGMANLNFELIPFYISIKCDIELLSELLLIVSTAPQSFSPPSPLEKLIGMVLIHSSDKGHFKSIFNYIKSFLNDEMKFKKIILKPKVIDNILFNSLKCGNAIEIFNFLIKELSISPYSEYFETLSSKLEKQDSSNYNLNNSLSKEYLKNKFNI